MATSKHKTRILKAMSLITTASAHTVSSLLPLSSHLMRTKVFVGRLDGGGGWREGGGGGTAVVGSATVNSHRRRGIGKAAAATEDKSAIDNMMHLVRIILRSGSGPARVLMLSCVKSKPVCLHFENKHGGS